MIFRQNMIVLITNGRLAGKKAVIVKELENDMLLVSGISRTPTESADFLPTWQKRRNEKFVSFVKKINAKHVLATRYKADIGLDKLPVEENLESVTNKSALNTQANQILKNAYEAKKAKWLFTQLSF